MTCVKGQVKGWQKNRDNQIIISCQRNWLLVISVKVSVKTHQYGSPVVK